MLVVLITLKARYGVHGTPVIVRTRLRHSSRRYQVIWYHERDNQMQISYTIIHGFPIVRSIRSTIHSPIVEGESMIFAMLKTLLAPTQQGLCLCSKSNTKSSRTSPPSLMLDVRFSRLTVIWVFQTGPQIWRIGWWLAAPSSFEIIWMSVIS